MTSVDIAWRPLPSVHQAGARPVQADFSAGLPFQASAFDAVACLSTLQYADDPRLVLAEFNRVLRPGGQLALVLPNMRAITRLLKLTVLGRFPPVSSDPGYDGGTRHYFCSQDVVDLLTRAGFNTRWRGGHIFRPAWMRWWPDWPAGSRRFKAEFFCAEMLILAEKQ